MHIPAKLRSSQAFSGLVTLGFLLALLGAGSLGAQVKCSLERQHAGTYVGFCIGQKDVSVRVELEPSASAYGLWRGRTSDTTGGDQPCRER